MDTKMQARVVATRAGTWTRTSGAPSGRRVLLQRVRAIIAAAVRRPVMLAVMAIGLCGIALYVRALQALPLLPLPYAFIQSPNCDNRPSGATVSAIVLHSTVEPTTEGTIEIFLTPQKQVSAHFVVGRDGRIVQMVRVEQRAWHAGVSILEGVGKVNDYSVGIEMVNLNDGHDPYPPEQLNAVAGIIRLIRSRYEVPDSRIVSHAQVALPGGRKSDPSAFDFDKIRALALAVPPPLPADPPPTPRVVPAP